MVRFVLMAIVCACSAGDARAESSSLFPRARASPDTVTRASLFSQDAGAGFFAPLPDHSVNAPVALYHGTGTTPVDQLLGLIAQAEAGAAGYDAIQYGARIRPARRPTQMTLGEIYQWIDNTPGQPHAIGRYQFIPDTLRRVASIRGFGPNTQFSAGVQDALALVLLEDAGLNSFQSGTLGRRDFMHNLAQIWAGLPLPNGRSYYEGYAGNSASMTWSTFDGGMARIWPARG